MSLEEVHTRMEQAAARARRDPADITLVAVGKSQPIEAIRAVYDQGHRDFGESKAQELVAKAGQLPTDIHWHFVGRLQRNKARQVRPLIVLLHSMDRVELGEAWLKGPATPPPVLVQVNIGREPQKGGVDPGKTAELLERLATVGIEVTGLMAIPPMGPAEDSRRYFGEVAGLREELRAVHPGLTVLSVGMSDDYEIAIEEGSTMVRVGRAIFGPRRAD